MEEISMEAKKQPDRRSWKSLLPIMIQYLTLAGLIFGGFTLLSAKMNKIENNYADIHELEPIVIEHEDRLDEMDISNAILETQLINIYNILREIRDELK